MKAAFKRVVEKVRHSTMLVKCDGKPAALATIVDANGWLVTKASELKAPIVCVHNGRNYPAKLVGVHKQTDLAMLKIDAKDLQPVEWANTDSKLVVGRWVVSAGTKELPLAIGNVSVPRRKIARPRGYLGIQLAEGDNAPKIVLVVPNSGAAKAGLKVGDVIRQVGSQTVQTSTALIKKISKYHPGDVIRLAIKRGEKAIDVEATLGDRTIFMPAGGRRAAGKLISGPLSRRRDGFPAAFTHDTVLKPAHCGGPLVDLSGQVVGINIARAGRTSTYALPTETIVALLDDLKSGKLAPSKAAAKSDAKPKQGDKKKDKQGNKKKQDGKDKP
ncbi:MAG: PDZ domain-containing protein [Planctomycetes bacterium]|nr:PDZ domain-containing protein [Planctomycetota bacterium]